jgi:hypothetical protein
LNSHYTTHTHDALRLWPKAMFWMWFSINDRKWTNSLHHGVLYVAMHYKFLDWNYPYWYYNFLLILESLRDLKFPHMWYQNSYEICLAHIIWWNCDGNKGKLSLVVGWKHITWYNSSKKMFFFYIYFILHFILFSG